MLPPSVISETWLRRKKAKTKSHTASEKEGVIKMRSMYILNCSSCCYLKRMSYEMKSAQQISLERLPYAKSSAMCRGHKGAEHDSSLKKLLNKLDKSGLNVT